MLMRTMSPLMILLILFASLTWSVAGLVQFSKGYRQFETITRVQGISIGECAQECERRPRCKSAMYRRHGVICILTPHSPDTQQPVPTNGVVLLSGFNTIFQAGMDCGGTTCLSLQTCIDTAQGNQVCDVTECPFPQRTGTSLLGNIYTVGSNIVDWCSGNKLRMYCDSDGYWHTNMTQVVHDCTDVRGEDSGVYNISQQQVYCDMTTDDGYWMVFQRRNNGSVDFERPWSDYKNGFGDLEGEFWQGLELVSQIVRLPARYELRIDMEDWDGNQRFALYHSFRVSDEADKYRLNVTGYSGNGAGDSLSYHSGRMFSTLDSDNDANGGSCAHSFRGAWWYGSCHHSNLNGLYQPGGVSDEYATHVQWRTWLGQYVSLRIVEMKFRRACSMSKIHYVVNDTRIYFCDSFCA